MKKEHCSRSPHGYRMAASFLAAMAMLSVAGCSQISVQTPAPVTQPVEKPVAVIPTPVTPAVPGSTETRVLLGLTSWSALPGWGRDDLAASFDSFVRACRILNKQAVWRASCAATATADRNALKRWFESNFRPWQQMNKDGSVDGLVTGYYEPIIRGSRNKSAHYSVPVYGPPDDMLTIDLADQYPELQGLRLRGRLAGKKVLPYYSRAEWSSLDDEHRGKPLLWVADVIDLFFLQIQGSGQVQLDDGSRVRIAYADQNGHPYRSIGKWLIDKGELTLNQSSMQGIRSWTKSNPARLQELLNVNPSVVFFRVVAVEGDGPAGSLGLPLTPQRAIAVDATVIPLGAPVWLATTYPLTSKPLQRLVLAADTGGAIRGAVRADFYWGSGEEAGQQAGRMRQVGQMWLLLPLDYTPPNAQVTLW